MVGDCELGNDPSFSIECCEFIDEMTNYCLPKKGPAAWVQLLVLKYNTSNETFVIPHKICDF